MEYVPVRNARESCRYEEQVSRALWLFFWLPFLHDLLSRWRLPAQKRPCESTTPTHAGDSPEIRLPHNGATLASYGRLFVDVSMKLAGLQLQKAEYI